MTEIHIRFIQEGMATNVGLGIVLVIVSYLVGSFPTGVFLSRRKYGIDVRETGSGNIGATNVTRTFGWYAGILTLVVDFLKGFVPLLVIKGFFPEEPWFITACGAALVLGHCFSIYLKFRGGKGVATSFGCVFVVAPLAAAVCGVFYLLSLIVTKISAAGSLVGVLVVLIYAVIMQPDPPVKVLIYAIAFIVVIRHHSNIRRLFGDIFGKKKIRSGGKS